jgi:biotin carboxyl carrier protein
MPARVQSSNTDRTESEWALQTQRDHEAIARLADDLLPALIAKLAASGLGEIEVRQGGWKARLRMPANAEEPKASAKAADAHAGHSRHAAHGRAEDLAVGMRVRSGDKIGTVNVLGVNQDVISPVEGIIGSSLAEAGEAVEYGQELIRIELPEPASATGIVGQEREPAAVAGKA